MNSKITQALSDVNSGDITAYFNEVDRIIQLNDGIHDCIILSMGWNAMIDQLQFNIINIQNSIYQMQVLIVLTMINKLLLQQ